MSTVYLIRCQGLGVIPDRVYLQPPTIDQLKEHLVAEVERHGLDKDGKPRVRWVMVQEAESANDDTHASVPWDDAIHVRKVEGMLDDETAARILAEKAGKLSDGAPHAGAAVGEPQKMAVHGVSTVVNPGEPGHVPDTGQKAARMMKQAETERRVQAEIAAKESERETMTLTAEDVGTLDK